LIARAAGAEVFTEAPKSVLSKHFYRAGYDAKQHRRLMKKARDFFIPADKNLKQTIEMDRIINQPDRGWL